MSLTTIEDVRTLIETSKTDVQLQALIDRIEAEITELIGAPQNDAGDVEITETLYPDPNFKNVYLKRVLSSVTSVTEDTVTLTVDESYRIHPAQGRIERLPVGKNWGKKVVVVYKPLDQRELRKEVVIELLRLQLARTGFASENIAGEWSYKQFDYTKERRRFLRRLTFLKL